MACKKIMAFSFLHNVVLSPDCFLTANLNFSPIISISGSLTLSHFIPIDWQKSLFCRLFHWQRSRKVIVWPSKWAHFCWVISLLCSLSYTFHEALSPNWATIKQMLPLVVSLPKSPNIKLKKIIIKRKCGAGFDLKHWIKSLTNVSRLFNWIKKKCSIKSDKQSNSQIIGMPSLLYLIACV